MPTIEKVNGWVIRMYANDHNPAHFHATKGGVEVMFNLIDMAFENRPTLRRADRTALTQYAIDNRARLIAEFDRLTG